VAASLSCWKSTRLSWLPAPALLLPSSLASSFAGVARPNIAIHGCVFSRAYRKQRKTGHQWQSPNMAANAETVERPQQTTNTAEAQALVATSNGVSASAPSTGVNENRQATQLLTPATATESSAANPQDGGDAEDSDEDEGSEDSSYCSSHYDSNGDWIDNNELDLQIERKNRLTMVDEQGVMRWLQHESAYVPAEIFRRTDMRTLCLYDYASPGELRKYVRDRGLPDPYPPGLTLKYSYIRLLEQADKVKSFRFLDLPAEMRNLIYAQLLIFGRCSHCPRVHEACHTGILRANKQVYKEAGNILYDDNEIRCNFGASGYEDEPEDFFSWIHVKETRGLSNSMDHIFLGMSQIPDWFRRIQCLRIDLDFCGGSVGAAGFKLQACLLNLASFLMDEHRLKKLKVVITNSFEDPDGDDDEFDEDGNNIAERLDATLYPLRRLRGLEQVEFIGVDKSLAKSTVAEMQKTSGPVFNTLMHFNNLREEAKGYARLLETVDPGSFGLNEPFGDEPGRLSNDIQMLVEELGDYDEMDGMYDPFADVKTETNTRRKMEELRDCLAKVQFLEFERRKKEFIKLRKNRTAYQMKSKWVFVDGKKKKSDNGLRRDWQPRLDDYDMW
jgi:hypothetical protein